MNVKLVGQWKQALRATRALAQRFKKAQEQAVAQEAHTMAGKVVEYVGHGVPPPLAKTTLATRSRGGRGGGSKGKPLNATGGLKRSIRAHKVTSEAWFVGILKSARSNRGEALYSIGAVHEYGATIVTEITEAAHRFLMAKFKHGGERGRDKRGRFTRGSIIKTGSGTGIAVIKIPPRPFLAPVFKAHAKPEDVRKRFEARFAKLFLVVR